MRSYTPYNVNPNFIEKLICIFSYLSAGMIGFIAIIFHYVTHRTMKPFVKFHAYQSIFLSVILYLLKIVFGIFLGVIKILPVIGDLILNIVNLLVATPIVFGYSILNFAIILLLTYLIYVSIKGEMGDIPWVSDNVKRMI